MIPAILMSAAGSVLSGVIQNAMASTGATEGTSQTLGKEDFLRLLTTQLRNQDPLNPLSNTEFVAQTAQFSSLEQLQNMNKTMEQLIAQLSSNGPVGAAALLGRVVAVNGSPVSLEAGEPVSLNYRLPASAASVAVQVQDEVGNLVRTIRLGQQGGGSHQISFDGLDDSGRPLASGTYTYRVQALDGTGRSIPGAVTLERQVTGISVEGSQLVLSLGDVRVPLSSVVGITAGTIP